MIINKEKKMQNVLKEDERIDELGIGKFKIIQNKKGFCFGIDSVLLSDFAKEIKTGSKVVDLGTGTGILGILLCAKTNLSSVLGVEIQEEVAEMARRSIVMNGLEKKFTILTTDVKKLKNKIKLNNYDVVITNPPYKKINTGKINENEKKLISKHEITADLSEFIKTSYSILKDNGAFYMVHRAERLSDIIYELRKNKLEPKIIRFVYSNEIEDSKLVLIKAIKNAKSFLKVDKPLYIYDNKGNYTSEIFKIYNK